MDLGRWGYTSSMRFTPGGPLVPIVWYRVPWGTPAYKGYHLFGRSDSWLNWEPRPDDALGEHGPRKWYRGMAPFNASGRKPCGKPEWFSRGVPAGTPPLALAADGFPACCDRVYSGLKISGRAVLLKGDVALSSGAGLEISGDAPQGGVVLVMAGGVLLSGTALQGEDVSMITVQRVGQAAIPAVELVQFDALAVTNLGSHTVLVTPELASISQIGAVGTGAQTFAGSKTFVGSITVGQSGYGELNFFGGGLGLGSFIRCLSSPSNRDAITTRAFSSPGSGGDLFTALSVSADGNSIVVDCGGTGQVYPPKFVWRKNASTTVEGFTGVEAGAEYVAGLRVGGALAAVTSVGASAPLASSGGFAPTLSISAAGSGKLFLAGPSGAAGAVALREIAPDDLPTQDAVADCPGLTAYPGTDETGADDEFLFGGCPDPPTNGYIDEITAALTAAYNRLLADVTAIRSTLNATLAELRSFKAIDT